MAKESVMTKVGLCGAIAAAFAMLPVQAQTSGSQAATPPAAEEKPEEGIPVTGPLVISKCGTCHTKDDKGDLSRISWERSTPEGWEEAPKRVVRLNGLTIRAAQAQSVVQSRSTYH